VRHVGGAALEGGLITMLVFGLIAGSTFAAKGGNGNGNGPNGTSGGHKTSVTITVPNGTFGTTDTASVSQTGLWVHATCSQYATTVYEQWLQTDGAGNATLTLGPTPMWSSGSASCDAEAGSWNSHGRWVVDAQTAFAVTD